MFFSQTCLSRTTEYEYVKQRGLFIVFNSYFLFRSRTRRFSCPAVRCTRKNRKFRDHTVVFLLFILRFSLPSSMRYHCYNYSPLYRPSSCRQHSPTRGIIIIIISSCARKLCFVFNYVPPGVEGGVRHDVRCRQHKTNTVVFPAVYEMKSNRVQSIIVN